MFITVSAISRPLNSGTGKGNHFHVNLHVLGNQVNTDGHVEEHMDFASVLEIKTEVSKENEKGMGCLNDLKELIYYCT